LNFLNKNLALIVAALLLSACGDHTDQTLSPPKNAHWVTVKFKVPEGTTLQPMQVMYRSDTCKDTSQNSSGKSYDIRGINGFKQNFTQQGQSNVWQTRIAIEGGGSCQWILNSIKVTFKLFDDNSLAAGKKNLETNYIFDFGDYGFSDGYGAGSARPFIGDIVQKTIFFPLIIHHLDKSTDFVLFGGNTDKEKWSRRYMLRDTKSIYIEPILNLDKVVILTPPVTTGSIVATYPDGSKEDMLGITPDYNKLLSGN
jgi:hypothetical protein